MDWRQGYVYINMNANLLSAPTPMFVNLQQNHFSWREMGVAERHTGVIGNVEKWLLSLPLETTGAVHSLTALQT